MAKSADKAPAYESGALYSFKVRKFTKLAGPPELKFRPDARYQADGAILNEIGANIDAASVSLQTETLMALNHAGADAPAGE